MINTKLQNSATEQNQDDSDKKSWFNNQLAWGASLVLAVPIAIAVAPVAVAGLGLAGGILATTAIGVGLVAGGAYLADSYQEKIEQNAREGSKSQDRGEEGATNIDQRLSALERGLRDITVQANALGEQHNVLGARYNDLDTKVDAHKREQETLTRRFIEKLNEFNRFFNALFQHGQADNVEDMLTHFNAAQANHAAFVAAEAARPGGAGADGAEGAGGGGRDPATVLREGRGEVGAGGGGGGSLIPIEEGDGDRRAAAAAGGSRPDPTGGAAAGAGAVGGVVEGGGGGGGDAGSPRVDTSLRDGRLPRAVPVATDAAEHVPAP